MFRNFSIRGKLLTVIMCASLFAMLSTGITLIVYQYHIFQDWLEQNMEYQADITGFNSASALLFNDTLDAANAVSALQKVDVVTGAALYLPNGDYFAGWFCDGCPKMPDRLPSWKGLREFDEYFMFVRDIMVDDTQAGAIVIRSTKLEKERFLHKSIFAVLVLLLPVTLITLLLSTWLRKFISRPVESLAAVARKISEERDFSIRAEKHGDDETGMLTDFFNIMLDRIEDGTRELRRQDRLLRSIIDNTNAMILLKDLNGRYILANRRFIKVFDLDQQEISGCNDKLVFSPASAADFRKRDEEVVDTGSLIEYEETITAGDNELTCLVSSFPLYDSSGMVYAVCTILTDITERKNYEERLRHLNLYLASVFNSMPSALIGLDDSGRIARVNDAAEKLLVMSYEDITGRDFMELVNVRFAGYAHDFGVAISSSDISKIQMKLHESGSREKFLEAVVYPLRSDISGAVIRIDDITDHIYMRDMMIQTEKMISVAGLAAGMAHEINNPLGIILQAVQNIRRRVSPGFKANAQYAEKAGVSLEAMSSYFRERMIYVMLDDIQDAGERAAGIVSNMLQFSRQGTSEKQVANIKEVLEQAVELAGKDYDLKKNFDFRQISISRVFDKDIPDVHICVTEIEQVLLNLFKNAAQALYEAREDGRQPVIITRLINEKDAVRIEIEDNGPGIPEDIRHKIFEPFFTTKPPGMGTGLGLAVAYMIVVQNHGGQMMVQSVPDHGTCFIIRLPVDKNTDKPGSD